jgi:hypothetical protein
MAEMSDATLETISQIERVMAEYDQRLTIRQIYYRLVADHSLENSHNSYKRIVRILGDARKEGIIEYGAIEDRTREITENDETDYITPEGHLKRLYDYISKWDQHYGVPVWDDQPQRVVVMVEKQALQGIFQSVCEGWEVDLMVCKGYPSLTQQWELTERMKERISHGEDLHLIYFGDFDPSGEDIFTKLPENLRHEFGIEMASMVKEALTIDQVEKWGIPAYPAKVTDTRTKGFVEIYGKGMQVELDAIKPDQLTQMIEHSINRHYDHDIAAEREGLASDNRERIRRVIASIDTSVLLEEIDDEY